eukprot:SAG11_NODE_26950_length_338_cov_14.648536_1_plen_52_part_10
MGNFGSRLVLLLHEKLRIYHIPCSNYFNSYLVDDGKMDPRTVGFGETIPLQT